MKTVIQILSFEKDTLIEMNKLIEPSKEDLQKIADIDQALQLLQTGVMARFNISEDELIKELEDKRICKLSDLPEDIYYLHRKETARWLLEKYDVFKK